VCDQAASPQVAQAVVVAGSAATTSTTGSTPLQQQQEVKHTQSPAAALVSSGSAEDVAAAAGENEDGSERVAEVWLVLEFANDGTLQDSVRRCRDGFDLVSSWAWCTTAWRAVVPVNAWAGWSRLTALAPLPLPPCCPPACGVQPRLLCRLSDVAAGMAYLHSKSIIHADLKASNVLLASSIHAPYGQVTTWAVWSAPAPSAPPTQCTKHARAAAAVAHRWLASRISGLHAASVAAPHTTPRSTWLLLAIARQRCGAARSRQQRRICSALQLG
jgi:hypothetical protein